MQKLVGIVGPTGSGKTALAVALAELFAGELVSADAKQVYRGMDIGTNKERELPVPQHLLDWKDPGEKVTAAEFQAKAYEAIDDIAQRGHLPLLVGGSMLYAEAVMNGYLFTDQGKSRAQKPHYQVLKLAPLLDREILRERLAGRTEEWLKEGLLKEIQHLLYSGVSRAWLEQCGLEYRYFTRHVLGELSLEEASRLTNISLNQYVKRQYTWWRRHTDIHWVENVAEAAQLVRTFLTT